ncbi:family 4 glycosyl hydrolase [Paenibacillus koleovorans]|uniref:family 4 glycosyl hydrolase n=1 Tax=Paenibacillus koleovorans TaxID=121608 RepID=UPI000FD9E97F|nr:hypothetical protein [Paenibacillus koleovorans]
MYNICIIGASFNWTRTIVYDMMAVFPERLHFRLVDLNPEAAEVCRQWGELATKWCGRQDTFSAFTERRQALPGADAVFIAIATGGFDAMTNDLLIPEKYGIYGTVGDTAGPGGWSRAIRNIPVFAEMARDFDELCPEAFIVNYTNPMSALTATLDRLCGNPVVGLCHSYIQTKNVLQHIFGLEDWSELSVSIAGMNHFSWVTDFKIGRRDGYAALRERIGGGSLLDLMRMEEPDANGFVSGHRLCAALYDTYGYIPYVGDRHTVEFLSYTLSNEPKRYTFSGPDGVQDDVLDHYGIKRTSLEARQRRAAGFKGRIQKEIAEFAAALAVDEPEAGQPIKSEEPSAELVRAYLTNSPMTEVVNMLNVGQIPGLPLGACVETFGMIDGLGIRPVMVDNVPESLLEIMRPQAINQKWVTEGVLTRNKGLLLQALYNDPQCKGLTPDRIRAMAEELLEANKRWFTL